MNNIGTKCETCASENKNADKIGITPPESCTTVVAPESCPSPVAVDINGCRDSLVFDAGDVSIKSLGRILQVDVTVKNVCPNKRVALAVILTEIDGKNELNRGFKAITVPAHNCTSCKDITVRCLKFVLPEDLKPADSTSGGMCDRRHFRLRTLANYIDSDFVCCQ